MGGRPLIVDIMKLSLGAWLTLGGAGCGVFSAIGNPKAAFALQEPAPMAVILRRADAARATATHVDRLLSATPVDIESKWIAKIALKKAEVEVSLKEIGEDPDYVVPPKAKVRVVQAEAWAKVLAGLCPHESKYPSLFHSVSPEIAAAYADVAGQAKAVAKLKADKEVEVKALEEKDISASDKEAHEKKKREIEEQIDKIEAEYKPKVEAFMGKLKGEVQKAPPEAKKQMGLAMVGFKRAVEDAKLSNSVALLRYPLAMPGMPQELKTQAKRIVADVVEDKTGHRPTLEKFDPDIKLDGGVKMTLNGLPPEAIPGLKPDALLTDVTLRAKDYATRVLTLAAYIAETQELLDLESIVIKSTMDGLEVDETKVQGAGEDLSELKVELEETVAANANAGAVTAKGGKGGKGGGTKSRRHPVPLASTCAEGGKGDGKKGDKGDMTKGKKGDKADMTKGDKAASSKKK
ncbi:Hypothetical protein A7982_06965 [Minicystis rosea]|nr:Hypothetical protein A7982_06965 [Minicystis rosea]